jgi:hypothetical protein
MTQKDTTLQDIYELLIGFIGKQESFNAKQESFNSRIETKIDRIQEEETANHNLSHRMILQAYGYINDIKTTMDSEKEPWLKGKK